MTSLWDNTSHPRNNIPDTDDDDETDDNMPYLVEDSDSESNSDEEDVTAHNRALPVRTETQRRQRRRQ